MTNKTSTSSSTQSQGLFESIKALTSTLVAIVHTRLELLSTDLEEDRERLMSLVILSLIALFSLVKSYSLFITLIYVTLEPNNHMNSLFETSKKTDGFLLVGELGLEPRLAESESAVLPLDDSPK